MTGAKIYHNYDAVGQLTHVLYPATNLYYPTYFIYDAAGRLTQEKDALGHVTTATYDAAGQLTKLARPDGSTYYEYDSMGRLVDERSHPATSWVNNQYVYDPSGALIEVNHSKVALPTEACRYDGAGQVIWHGVGRAFTPDSLSAGFPMPLGSDGFHRAPYYGENIYYQYDAVGNCTSLTYQTKPEAAYVTYFTYYQYDHRNLLSQVKDPWGGTTYYTRDPLGLESKKQLPNGVTTYHNYNDAAQVSSILHVGPSGLLQAFYYEYDNDGRVNQVVREDGKAIYYDYESEYGGGDRLAHETWRTGAGTALYGFTWGYNFAGDCNSSSAMACPARRPSTSTTTFGS